MHIRIALTLVAAAALRSAPAAHAQNYDPQNYATTCRTGCRIWVRGKSDYIVAGDEADNNVYIQPLNGRANGKWEFIVMGANPYDYWICDQKHRRCLVAGDNFDGNVYHQQPNERMNGRWRIIRSNQGGKPCLKLVDRKHEGPLGAYGVDRKNNRFTDGRLHQDTWGYGLTPYPDIKSPPLNGDCWEIAP